jgi:hypothetical protein
MNDEGWFMGKIAYTTMRQMALGFRTKGAYTESANRTTTSGGVKMSDNSPFLILEQSCDDAIDWLSGQVSRAGLRVVRTFDLQVARHAHVDCPCPHHGTDQCDCQMVVLLIYQTGRQPVSIVAHGYNGQTWFSVVDTPQQRADPHLEATIRHTLAPEMLPPINLQNVSHAS